MELMMQTLKRRRGPRSFLLKENEIAEKAKKAVLGQICTSPFMFAQGATYFIYPEIGQKMITQAKFKFWVSCISYLVEQLCHVQLNLQNFF